MVFKVVLSFYFTLIASLTVGDLHTFYISTCFIRQDGDRVVVDYRIFMDDLAQALKKNQVSDDANAYCAEVATYVKEHFNLSLNSRAVELRLVGCDIAGEAQLKTVSCKLVGDLNYPTNAVISIESSVLVEEFEDQVNMMHVRLDGIKKSVNLDKGKTSVTL